MSGRRAAPAAQRGLSLLVVLVVLLVIAVLGSAAARITVMSARGARNERDTQLAWQAAEAALADAELDLRQSPDPARSRSAVFVNGAVDITQFAAGCGTSGRRRGLCLLPGDPAAPPAWLAADFTVQGDGAPTAAFGEFTGRAFAAGGSGPQPARPPRYLIELVPDEGLARDLSVSPDAWVFRVTALGVGPRGDEVAVVQAVFRN